MNLLQRLFHKPPPKPATPREVKEALHLISNIATELINALNDERVSRNIPRLRLDSKLCQAASKHAVWMSEHNQCVHGEPIAQLSAEKYSCKAIGINIAVGYRSLSSVMSAWMASSAGERRNILSIKYSDAGFAMVNNFWCAILAEPGRRSNSDIEISLGGPTYAPLCG